MDKNINIVKGKDKKFKPLKNQLSLEQYFQYSNKKQEQKSKIMKSENDMIQEAIQESKKSYKEEQGRQQLLEIADQIKSRQQNKMENNSKQENQQYNQAINNTNSKNQNKTSQKKHFKITYQEENQLNNQKKIIQLTSSESSDQIEQDINSFKFDKEEQNKRNYEEKQRSNNFFNKNEKIDEIISEQKSNILKPTDYFQKKYKIQIINDDEYNIKNQVKNQNENQQINVDKMDIEQDNSNYIQNSEDNQFENGQRQPIKEKQFFQKNKEFIEQEQSSSDEENQKYFQKFNKKIDKADFEKNNNSYFHSNKKSEKIQIKDQKKINENLDYLPLNYEIVIDDNEDMIKQNKNNFDKEQMEFQSKRKLNQLNINFEELDLYPIKKKHINYRVQLPNQKQFQQFNERKMIRFDISKIETQLSKSFLQLHSNLEQLLEIPKNKFFFTPTGPPAKTYRQQTLNFFQKNQKMEQEEQIEPGNKNNYIDLNDDVSQISNKSTKQKSLLSNEHVFIDIKDKKKREFYQKNCQQMGANVYFKIPDSFEHITIFIYDEENLKSQYLQEILLYSNVLVVSKFYLKKIYRLGHRNIDIGEYQYKLQG